MSVYLKVSWDQEFGDLMMHLMGKYGRKMFSMNGIGEQLDLNDFAKKFFKNTTTTADVSVDGNANVTSKSVIDFNFEFQKPLQKYNSHFLLWKSLREDYGLLVANEIIEMQISGDIYINDFSDIARPYSYHPHTLIVVDGKELTMEAFFEEYSHLVEEQIDREVINLEGLGLPFSVFDGTKYVKMTQILRHKSHTDLLQIETKNGSVSVVTEDHPFITEDHPDGIAAGRLKIGDLAILANRTGGSAQVANYDPELAYLMGAMAGDGHVSENEAGFTQKNVLDSHFYGKFEKHFSVSATPGSKRLRLLGGKKVAEVLKQLIGSGSQN